MKDNLKSSTVKSSRGHALDMAAMTGLDQGTPVHFGRVAFTGPADALVPALSFVRSLLLRPYYIVHLDEILEAQAILPYALRRLDDTGWWVLLNWELMPLCSWYDDGPFPGPESDKDFPSLHVDDPMPALPDLANSDSTNNILYLYGSTTHPLLSPATGVAYVAKLEQLLARCTRSWRAAVTVYVDERRAGQSQVLESSQATGL